MENTGESVAGNRFFFIGVHFPRITSSVPIQIEFQCFVHDDIEAV